jgi:hypothetical protein
MAGRRGGETMSMDKKTEYTAMLQIEKDHLAPLIARFGMVQNELSGLFDMPPATEQSAAASGSWWVTLPEEQQHLYRGALAAVASPLLIADVSIISHNERLINTHAVLPSLRWNDPVYLFAGENNGKQFRLEYLMQADLFTNTVLLHLQGAAPVYEMAMKFTVPVRDFAVLLAAADLRQRLRYKALLDHAVFPSAYRSDAIAAAVTEGFTFPDPRWLLPFCLPALHLRNADTAPEALQQSLDRLVKTGLLAKDQDTISFTEPGERFVDSVGGRSGCIRIETYGVDAAGNNGRQSVILIRGEYFLWYAGISGTKTDTMIVTTIGLDQAEALLKELFTPLAVPKAVEPVCPVTPAVVQAPAPAVSPQKATGGAGKKFCPSCGKPLRPGLKFCSSCGAKIV